MSVAKTGRLPMGWKLGLLLLPLGAALAALGIGRYAISPKELMGILLGHFTGGWEASEMAYKAVWNLRVPRILLALLVGAGLSTAGCAFQSLFANPLATPDTVGVAGGAGFGAALGIVAGFDLLGIQVVSFAMGLAAVALTWLAGTGKGKDLSTVILSGIMIGALFNALLSLVKYVADSETQLPAITYWLMGGLNNAGYRSLIFGAPPILLGMGVLCCIRWKLNLLPLSGEEAASLGVSVRKLRAITVLCATMITAACVSMCGQVGWVGLLIPHMCRMKFGSNHLSLLPASISVGAAFMVCVDTLARSMTAAEIPVSILTAMIGAPFFIILMRKTGGGQL